MNALELELKLGVKPQISVKRPECIHSFIKNKRLSIYCSTDCFKSDKAMRLLAMPIVLPSYKLRPLDK